MTAHLATSHALQLHSIHEVSAVREGRSFTQKSQTQLGPIAFASTARLFVSIAFALQLHSIHEVSAVR